MNKKKPKIDYSKQVLEVLQELHTLYPSYSIGTHLSTVSEELGDMWGVSDKELHYVLSKYKAQLEMYVPQETIGDELEKIIEDGMNLSTSELLENQEDNG